MTSAAVAHAATATEAAPQPIACSHCGLPVPASDAAVGSPAFCCAGCRSVYEIVNAAGLTGYYQYRDEGPAAPARARSNRTYQELDELAFQAEQCRAEPNGEKSVELLLDGVHLVRDALASGHSFEIAAVSSSHVGSDSEEAQAARSLVQAGVEVVQVPDAVLAAMSPVRTPSGLVAIANRRPTSMSEVCAVQDAFVLVAVDVQDPGNVGTLLRTAAAAGVRHAITGPGCAFLWLPKVMRAAMGAHFVLDLHEQVPPRTLQKAFGGEILAADATGGEDLFKAEWGGDQTLWMFGAEGQGFSQDTLSIAKRRLQIPVDSRVDSLNVSAAAAVCLFEQKRRRTSRVGN